MSQFQLSALTRRTLRLCGECVRTHFYRRDAEHAETTQRRNLKLRHYQRFVAVTFLMLILVALNSSFIQRRFASS